MDLKMIYLLEPVNVGNATTAYFNAKDYEIKRVEQDLFTLKSKITRSDVVYVTMHQVKYFTLKDNVEQRASKGNTRRIAAKKNPKAEQAAVL